MSNVLTGKVVITAPNVAQTMQGVSVSVNKASAALKTLPTASYAATLSLTNLGRVVQDAPFGFLGIANNLNPLLESFQRLKVSTGSNMGALKALGSSLTGAGGLGLALSVASSLAIVFGDKLFGVGKQAEKAKTAADALRDSISGVFKDIAKEATEVGSLVAILKSETETRERRLSAIKELQRIQPDIFNGLKLEGEAVVGLDAAYTAYLANLKNVIAAKIIQARLEQKIEQLLRLQGAAATESEKALQQATKNIRAFLSKQVTAQGESPLKGVFDKMDKESKDTIDTIQSDINGLFKDLAQFSNAIKLPSLKVKPTKVQLDEPQAIYKLDTPLRIGATFKIEKSFEADNVVGKEGSRLKDLTDFGLKPITVPLKLNLSPEALANQANIKSIREAATNLTDAFNNALKTSFATGFAAIGEGIGNLLSGQDFGNQIFQVFGTLFSEIGKALIEFGILRLGIEKIFKNPLIPAAIPIGLGIAAVAIGQLMKNIRGARADGGPVVGGQSYLVGERGPEIFTPNTGGGITANHRMGGNRVSSGGFGGNVTFRIAGKDLIGTLVLAQASQQRLV